MYAFNLNKSEAMPVQTVYRAIQLYGEECKWLVQYTEYTALAKRDLELLIKIDTI